MPYQNTPYAWEHFVAKKDLANEMLAVIDI